MRDLIECLNILLKYIEEDVYAPTHCSHDELSFGVNIDIGKVSKEDIERLDELGVFWCEIEECFKSFRFGSC